MPSGWLLCDGSAISRETYSALFDAVGTTYGTGDGSTTFNVPNLVDKFIEGSATSGTEHSAGLPNITGQTDLWAGRGGINPSETSGAFYGSYATGAVPKMGEQVSGLSSDALLHIDASRSSAIYGNSSTVQPPALTMCYAIYKGIVGKYCWLRQS